MNEIIILYYIWNNHNIYLIQILFFLLIGFCFLMIYSKNLHRKNLLSADTDTGRYRASFSVQRIYALLFQRIGRWKNSNKIKFFLWMPWKSIKKFSFFYYWCFSQARVIYKKIVSYWRCYQCNYERPKKSNIRRELLGLDPIQTLAIEHRPKFLIINHFIGKY